MVVPYKPKWCERCQESTEHFDDRQYNNDPEKWTCIQCIDRADSEDALDHTTDDYDDEGIIYDEF